MVTPGGEELPEKDPHHASAPRTIPTDGTTANSFHMRRCAGCQRGRRSKNCTGVGSTTDTRSSLNSAASPTTGCPITTARGLILRIIREILSWLNSVAAEEFSACSATTRWRGTSRLRSAFLSELDSGCPDCRRRVKTGPRVSRAYQLGALTARTAEHPVGFGKQSMLHRRSSRAQDPTIATPNPAEPG